MGLTSRVVVAVEDDDGRLVALTAGRLGPAPAVHGILGVVGFLSVALVVEEGVGRLVVAVTEPLAAVVFSRVLPVRAGLVTPAAGCDADQCQVDEM